MAAVDPGYIDNFEGMGGGGNDEYEAPIEDVKTLNQICDAASEGNEESWEEVRQWLDAHGTRAIQEGAQYQGEYQTTALHLACRNCPPLDIIEILLGAAPDIVRWADTFGWLPLHYACANGASEDVLRILADAYPESKTATDRRGRTPLHFALGNTESPATAAAVVLLSSTGAASCPDENGMLPLHYACAYGAPEEALHVLTDNNADSITQTDRNGRTPLHFALGNADRAASPNVVRLLLAQNPDVVNIADNDRADLPLHLLATRANTLNETQKDKRENAMKCLDLYLNANPHPTAAFLAALQSLPEWLRDHAVVTPTVKNVLNEKISKRFPTAVLLLDLYMLIAVIIAFSVDVTDSINRRFDDTRDDAVPFLALSPLYIGAGYFLIREVVQMLSLLGMGIFNTWLTSLENWIDVTFIFLVLFLAIIMNTGKMDPYDFRTFSALSFIVLCGNVIYFLKNLLIDFAIFVNALSYIVNHLPAFLMALSVILVAFAQIFYTLFLETDKCEEGYEPSGDDPGDPRAFCDFWTSLLKVITMLLGEVNEQDFRGEAFATFFFILFMFLVVILLANILIAIVTDSYSVIKNERAAIVFWSNRLDFIAEMDAILAGPWKRKVGLSSRSGDEGDDPDSIRDSYRGGAKTDSFRELWKKLMDLFEDDIDDDSWVSIEFFCVSFLRAFTAAIIPLWLAVGALSAGWLWPPQVREYILTQRITKGGSDLKESEQRSEEVKELSKGVTDVHDEILIEMKTNRTDVVAMTRQVTGMRVEMTDEMKDIKEILNELFELQLPKSNG